MGEADVGGGGEEEGEDEAERLGSVCGYVVDCFRWGGSERVEFDGGAVVRGSGRGRLGREDGRWRRERVGTRTQSACSKAA